MPTLSFLRVGICLAALVVSSAPLQAQTSSEPDVAADRQQLNPAMFAFARGVRDDSMVRPLTLERFDASVHVRGAVGIVMQDMTFSAPEAGTEGRLTIDLPAGAIVTGYALEIDGALIEGALVDQARAVESFDQLVRGRVDPGLGEITRDGAFTTRVFPVGPEGRRIVLRYTVPVGDRPGLAWQFDESAGQWSVALPDGTRSGSGAGRVEATLVPTDHATLASTHGTTGETYVQLAGELPEARLRRGTTMAIHWDSSRSRRDHDHAAALRTIEAAVAAFAPDRMLFAPTMDGTAPSAETSVGALRGQVDKLTYIGSNAAPADIGGDVCFYVSDGQVTDGSGDTGPDCARTYVIATGPAPNLPLLQSMTRGGGQVLRAGEVTDWSAPGIERVSSGGSALPFVALPAPDGQYRLVAKLASRSTAPIRVEFGSGSRNHLPIPNDLPATSGASVLFEARQAALLDTGLDREAFVSHSRRYGIASPTLPFLSLDRIEDHVQFGVSPQADHPQLARYRRLAKEAAIRKAEDKEDRFAAILALWNAEKEWWGREFDLSYRLPANDPKRGNGVPPPPPPPPVSPRGADPSTIVCPDGTLVLPDTICTQPPPAPPPPPPPPPEPERDVEDAQIVVTGTRLRENQMSSVSPVSVVSDESAEASAENRASDVDTSIRIALDARYPDRDYLAAFDAEPAAFDTLFKEWDAKAGDLPSFYLDTADWLWQRGRRDLALRVLDSALELPLANATTYAMVANKREAWGLAPVWLRRKQASLETHRPQASRLLALALARQAELTLADGDRPQVARDAEARAALSEAVGLLTTVALTPADPRWQGIEIIALREANALIPRLKALGGEVALDERLVANLHSDIRVVMEWTADAVDLDLHVLEPSGENVFYGNRTSRIGGRMTDDMTAGFGPEEYVLRRAPGGRFDIKSNLFASDRIDPNGSPRLRARLIRDFGRPEQREELVEFEMNNARRDTLIGSIRLGPAGTLPDGAP